MSVTFYGQFCLAVEATGKSLFFDPFVCQDELARDVDVPAIRAAGSLFARGGFGHVADAGHPGAFVKFAAPTPGF